MILDKDSPLRPVLRGFRSTAAAVATLGMIATLLEGLAVALMVPLISLMIGSGISPMLEARIDILEPRFRIPALIFIIFGLILAKCLVAIGTGALIAKAESRGGHALRTVLVDRLLHVRHLFFLRNQPSELVNILSGETWRAVDALRSVLGGATSAASVAAFTVLMIWLNWRLFLVVLVGALLIRIVESRLVATTSYRSEDVKRANSRLADRTLRIILSMRVVRAFGQEHREADRFAEESDALAGASYRVWMSGNSLSPVLEVLHTGLLVIIVLLATIIDRSSSLPQIAAFLILLQRAQPHLRGLEQARIQFATASSSVVAVERLLAGLDREMPSITERGQTTPPALGRSIAFDRVSFTYPAEGGERRALDAVSFSIPAHGATALVGPSGAGKSTIVNLLLRLYDPSSGRITIDGIPLAEIDLAAWRACVALAGQDIELIEGSIAQNIAYGQPDATMDEIVEAATVADVHTFIQKLPAGYETDVGARGLALSGGQRQRIGLARALIRRPALLILDEATSAVDALSESRILELLDQYRKDRTLLIISHHQSTIARCDNVIRLEHGRANAAATTSSIHAGEAS